MWKWIKKIFRKIKNFFTEPELKPIERGKLDIYEREKAGIPLIPKDIRDEEQLEYKTLRQKKGRYIYDEKTDSWVLVTERKQSHKALRGWGSADVFHQVVDRDVNVYKKTFEMHATEDFHEWTDYEVLDEFYVQADKKYNREYSQLIFYKVDKIERIRYI